MISLIAESKTMDSGNSNFKSPEFNKNIPLMEDMAIKTMDFIKGISAAEISERLGISHTLAVKAHSFALDFFLKDSGEKALDIFTGEFYKALDVKSLNEDAIKRADENVLIVSSLYGLLKPDDFIKPYRLEFNKDCGPDGNNIIKYLKPKVTVNLVKILKEKSEKEILDLLPGDASKCVDWKLVKAFTKVMKPDFKTVGEGGKLITPHAGCLKELRGKMLRMILLNNINSFKDLLDSSSPDFEYVAEMSKPGLPLFIAE